MVWQDIVVASEYDAKRFLDQALHCTIGGYLRTRCPARFPDEPWRYSAECRRNEDSAHRIFDLEVATDGAVRLTNLNIAPNLHGRHLGAMALKAAIGLAHEQKTSTLSIGTILGQGTGFWPYMGALPSMRPVFLPHIIAQVAHENAALLPRDARRKVEYLGEFADITPYAAWRALAQSDIRLIDGRRFNALVFGRGWQGDEMSIPLSDPWTRRLLQRRLGALPAIGARPFGGRHRTPHAAPHA